MSSIQAESGQSRRVLSVFAVESLAADIVSARSGLVEHESSDVRGVLVKFRSGEMPAEVAFALLETMDDASGD